MGELSLASKMTTTTEADDCRAIGDPPSVTITVNQYCFTFSKSKVPITVTWPELGSIAKFIIRGKIVKLKAMLVRTSLSASVAFTTNGS